MYDMADDAKQKFEELLQELLNVTTLYDDTHSVQDPSDPDSRLSLSFEDEDVFLHYNQETNKTQPINWKNNLTRLNEFNMNTLVSFISQYANWAAEKSVRYYAETSMAPVIEELIRHSAGWTTDSTTVVKTDGEIFNDYVNSTATGAYSAVFGENNNAENPYELVIGRFNAPQRQAVFVVGWGMDNDSRRNVFVIDKDGNVKASGSIDLDGNLVLTKGDIFVREGDVNVTKGDINVSEGHVNIPTDPTKDEHAVNKLYVDTEVARLKQLNQWIGNVEVTSEEYDLENNNRLLRPILSIFVENQSPVKRHPRNGDLVTVTITDKKPTDPQYPTMWIYLVPDPYNPPDPEGQVIDDYWQFYSSQQELLNASKDTKGLVQIGDNINVNEGLISIPLADGINPGVVYAGEFISIINGKVSIAADYTEGVSRQINNLNNRLTNAESNIELNSQNINNLSATVADHTRNINAMQASMSSLDKRVSNLEAGGGGGGGEVKGIYWIEF